MTQIRKEGVIRNGSEKVRFYCAEIVCKIISIMFFSLHLTSLIRKKVLGFCFELVFYIQVQSLEDASLLEAASAVLGLDYVFSILGLKVCDQILLRFCVLAPEFTYVILA